MDSSRMKYAAQWLYGKVFQDEPIQPRTAPKTERVPSLIRTARSLENNLCNNWQSRESIFLKQAKLLALQLNGGTVPFRLVVVES